MLNPRTRAYYSTRNTPALREALGSAQEVEQVLGEAAVADVHAHGRERPALLAVDRRLAQGMRLGYAFAARAQMSEQLRSFRRSSSADIRCRL